MLAISHLALVALAILPLVSVAGQTENKHHLDPLDPKCPQGQYPGFEVNTFQFDVPAAKFYDATGSFFHSEWYSGPIASTHGKDNTPGATRNATFNGTTYRERLVEYSRSPSKLILRYTLDSGLVVFVTGAGPHDTIAFGSYTEELGLYSICAGRATYFTLTAVYCTDKVATAYDGYDRLKRAAIADVAVAVGAKVFDGTCRTAASQVY
ncbi:hypothetical protein Hypma_001893 [Hypsizygus marmoreus]|uniref:Uncharacterized protein n=1 Tax=Hypsizygus marmoreus TaxID=39966 RepID=A0A369J825_HYPMA|nr:hypothetical protein Hypma_001893 [Hypsizygus marmoreus]